MANVTQTWGRRCTIGGAETSIISASIDYGVRRVATCDLEIRLPLSSNVTNGADVTVEASRDGDWMTLFTGTVRMPDPQFSSSGAVARVACEGPLYRTTYPIGRVVFAGGAKSAPQTIISTAKHLGTATVMWYALHAPTGITYDVTATPLADSDFVWLAGLVHGSNSYETSIGDKKIKKWSRVELYQSGDKIGYANLPESNEQWSSMLDYTNVANWTDLDVFIAAPIVAASGDVTFRFISGYEPGTSTHDEYEVDDITWQTAGKQSIRDMVRGLLRRAGLTTPQYSVFQVTDINGNVVKLGGNGLVDAGQVVIDERNDPLNFMTGILDLFGYSIHDCPDGVVRMRPFRGQPDDPAVATFAEAVSILGVPRSATNPHDVYNRVLVEGASATDQLGRRFNYHHETADVDVLPHPLIPDPPGENLYSVSNSLLVSNALCTQAGEIAEANVGDARFIQWDTWPHELNPTDVVTVTAPTVDFTGDLFVESFHYDIDSDGYRMSVSGWAGSSTLFSETGDPDPTTDPDEPVAPRPDDEWLPYSPLGGFA